MVFCLCNYYILLIKLTEIFYTGLYIYFELYRIQLYSRFVFDRFTVFQTINHEDAKMALDKSFNSKFTVLPVDILFVCKYICKYNFFQYLIND